MSRSYVLTAAGPAGAAAPSRVLSVYDGDTLAVATGARVRLLQIDTPDLGSGSATPGRRAAPSSASPRGKPVRLEAGPALDTVDGYGRILRYVWRGSLNVNLELVPRPGGRPPPTSTGGSKASTPAACSPLPSGTCDPNYSGGCVPPYPPDVDCWDLRVLGIGPVRVVGDDVHRLDGAGGVASGPHPMTAPRCSPHEA